MVVRRFGTYAVAVALSALWGCTLLVDVSDIDRKCATDHKICGGRCVRKDDPAYGCTTDLCVPCEFTNGVPRCLGNRCLLDSCLFGFGCSGCTANILVDRNHCGMCGHPCDSDQSCRDGRCEGT